MPARLLRPGPQTTESQSHIRHREGTVQRAAHRRRTRFLVYLVCLVWFFFCRSFVHSLVHFIKIAFSVFDGNQHRRCIILNRYFLCGRNAHKMLKLERYSTWSECEQKWAPPRPWWWWSVERDRQRSNAGMHFILLVIRRVASLYRDDFFRFAFHS